MGAASPWAGEPSAATPRQNGITSPSLLARLRAADQDAWRDCVTLYAPLVVRWCRRRGLGEADTADVAQDVFRKVVENLPRFRKEAPADSFRGWLCRIAHNEIAQRFRRPDAAGGPAGGTAAMVRLQQHPDRTHDGSEEDAREETSYLYHRAVELVRGEFSDLAWRMFWRVAVDGNEAAAVAAELGTTAAAVRQAKSRVLRRLKQALGDVPD